MKAETKSIVLGLELRAVEGEERRFTGIATTATEDRYSEIVLPSGGQFTLPVVLLAFHNARTPVGKVTKASVTDAAIQVEAEFVPSGIDAETDRVYGLARAGALRGLSIGFRPLESEMDSEGRLVHTKWELLEVSLVAIPANPDCEIVNIKETSVTKKSETPEVETPETPEERQPQGELRSVGQPPALHLKKREYSLSRMLRAAVGDVGVDAGYEREVHQELARTRGRPAEGILVPLSAFKKKAHDGITASPDTGKSLTGEDRREALFMNIDEFFRPPVAAALGVTLTQCDEDKLIIPRQKKRLTTGWIARDGTAAASQDAEFDALTLQPTTLSLQFEMKRSLMYATHPQAEALLISDARQAIELGLDVGILAGTGATNQPLGFLGTGGATVATSVSSAMNTGNAYDHSRKLRDEVEAYLKASDPSLKWCFHPLHVALLKKAIAFASATTPLVPNDSTVLADRSYVESYGLPTPAGGPPKTTKGLFGDYSEAVACVFGPAAELVLNPYETTAWSKGSVLARALVDFNIAHRDIKRVIRFDTETL